VAGLSGLRRGPWSAADSSGRRQVGESPLAFVLERDFTTNFSVKWMFKDIGLIREERPGTACTLLLTGLTRRLFQTALAAGHGGEEICFTINVLETITWRGSGSSKINIKKCCFQKWNLLLLE
jgi:hypothetical protein